MSAENRHLRPSPQGFGDPESSSPVSRGTEGAAETGGLSGDGDAETGTATETAVTVVPVSIEQTRRERTRAAIEHFYRHNAQASKYRRRSR